MSRRSAAFPLLLALGLLAGCAGAEADQSGPLDVGPASGEPENIICSPIEPDMGQPGFAETVQNRTDDPAEILSVELAGARNLEVKETGAWKLEEGALMYYLWSDAMAARDQETADFIDSLSPAAGYVINPGENAGVAVTAEVQDPTRPAGAHQLLVRYESNGREYAEVTNVSYKLEPDGCD